MGSIIAIENGNVTIKTEGVTKTIPRDQVKQMIRANQEQPSPLARADRGYSFGQDSYDQSFAMATYKAWKRNGNCFRSTGMEKSITTSSSPMTQIGTCKHTTGCARNLKTRRLQ